VRVHISAKYSDFNITTVKCRSFHRRAPSFLPVVYECHVEMMSHRVHTQTDTQTDKTANLLISSNVHFVYLGGDNYTKSWEGFKLR